MSKLLDLLKGKRLDQETFIEILSGISDDEKYDVVSKYETSFLNQRINFLIAFSIESEQIRKKIIETIPDCMSDYQRSVIVASLTDEEYKKNVIKSYNGDKKYNLNIKKIISSLKKDSIREIVNDYKVYNINSEILIYIAIILENKKDILNNLYEEEVFGKINEPKKIKLDDEQTVGIEIEFIGKDVSLIEGYELEDNWVGKTDCSLFEGREVISPIMYSNRNYEKQINKVCNILSAFNCKVDDTCGGHIHYGADYFNNDVDVYKVFLNIYRKVERLLFLISNEENIIPREAIVENALLISPKINEFIELGLIDLDGAATLDEFLNAIKMVQDSKYYSINFYNVGNSEKNTIEYRIPNSTLNPNVWIDNINLFGSIMRASKEIANIEKKNINDLKNDEKEKLIFYYNLIYNDLNEEQKLESLLIISIENDDRDIYKRRYYSNRNLEKNVYVDNMLDETGKPKIPVKLRK